MKSAEQLYERIWQDQASATYSGGNLRVDLTARVVSSGNRHLDLGCGDGVLGGLIGNRFSEVVGVDISEAALIAAERRGLRAFKVNLDEEDLPFPEGHFDSVTCLDLIEHVFEPRALVKKIARVLSRGGSLYIAFPNMRYLLRIKELLAGRFPKTSGDTSYAYDGGHLHYYTPADVRSLLAERELAVIQEWGIVSPGIRKNWKYRTLRRVLPDLLQRELLSIEILQKAVKS